MDEEEDLGVQWADEFTDIFEHSFDECIKNKIAELQNGVYNLVERYYENECDFTESFQRVIIHQLFDLEKFIIIQMKMCFLQARFFIENTDFEKIKKDIEAKRPDEKPHDFE